MCFRYSNNPDFHDRQSADQRREDIEAYPPRQAHQNSFPSDRNISRSRPDNLPVDSSYNSDKSRSFQDSGHLESTRGPPESRHSVALNPSFDETRRADQERFPDPRRAQSQFDLSQGYDNRDPDFDTSHQRDRSYSVERDFELSGSKYKGISLQDLRLAGRTQSVETLLRQQEPNVGRELNHPAATRHNYRSEYE